MPQIKVMQIKGEIYNLLPKYRIINSTIRLSKKLNVFQCHL